MAGMGELSMGMPGSVMDSDKLASSGNAVAAAKSRIFVLLCGGPSHVDIWDMKPNAFNTIRGPYQPISTKLPGMRINEMHTELAKVTDQFTLINSMTHPGESVIISMRGTTCSARSKSTAAFTAPSPQANR